MFNYSPPPPPNTWLVKQQEASWMNMTYLLVGDTFSTVRLADLTVIIDCRRRRGSGQDGHPSHRLHDNRSDWDSSGSVCLTSVLLLLVICFPDDGFLPSHYSASSIPQFIEMSKCADLARNVRKMTCLWLPSLSRDQWHFTWVRRSGLVRTGNSCYKRPKLLSYWLIPRRWHTRVSASFVPVIRAPCQHFWRHKRWAASSSASSSYFFSQHWNPKPPCLLPVAFTTCLRT